MQSKSIPTNPFLKKTKIENTIPTRWAKLEVSEENEKKKNNFLSREEDGIFDNTAKKTGFKSLHPGRNFMRYTARKEEPPPKPFNLDEMKDEFPALGAC